MSNFLESLIGDVLGIRRKRSRGVRRFLTRGAGSFLKTSLLMGGAGIAWSLVEEMLSKAQGPKSTTTVESSNPAVTTPQSTLKVDGPEPTAAPAPGDLALVVTRLLICAARVDGELAEEELAFLVEHARQEGISERMRTEWQSPRPLNEITAALSGEAHRRDAYTLTYSVLRADEDVNGSEQIFLAQLAHGLRLDPETTAKLEQEAAGHIDREAGD